MFVIIVKPNRFCSMYDVVCGVSTFIMSVKIKIIGLLFHDVLDIRR